MSKGTYGRGQVEWALWCSFVGSKRDIETVPKVFRTRIKRLIEIDKELDLKKMEVPPEADYAFAPPPSAKSGEVAYSGVDAFCLAIALDLLDAGFKQAEVVMLMRYLRPDFQDRYPKLLESPLVSSRRRYSASKYPGLPSYKADGEYYADGRLFVVLQKVELTEIVPASLRPGHAGPIILEPVFCKGVVALAEEMSDIMPNQRRAVLVLEVTSTAETVHSFLSVAPDIRRGRPKI